MYGWCTHYTQHKTLPKSPASLKFSFIIVFRYFFSPLHLPRTVPYIVALTMFALNSYIHTSTHARACIHILHVYNYDRARTSLWKGMRDEMAFWLHIYILCRYRGILYPGLSFLRPVNKQYSPDSGDIIINEVCLVYPPTQYTAAATFSLACI